MKPLLESEPEWFTRHEDPCPTLLSELRDGALFLTLNRPDARNALNADLARALLSELLTARHRPEVRAIILRGAGSAFCAGDDLASVDDYLDGGSAEAPAIVDSGDSHYLRIIEAIVTCGKPVLAAIGGGCAGAGTEIACAADLRLASDRARIGSCLVSVGQVGNAVMLPRVIGPAAATELYISGRLVDAAEALSLGLVHEVVPHGRFDERVEELGLSLAQKPTKAIALFKELRERALGQPVEFGLRLQDAFHIRNNHEVEDGVEGVRAFVEKRPPRFTGR